ncbi:hypothetical protein [Vibrio sp. TBV020]|uniref:hypothetical protein n=1 Tax=Vibrio sp. TBV020 TaxID=3137398 RepID=UPI0038CDC7F5
MHAKHSLKNQKGSVAIAYLALLIPMLAAVATTVVIGYQIQWSNRAIQATDSAAFACEFKGEVDREMMQGYLDYYSPEANNVDFILVGNTGCVVNVGYQESTIFSSLTLSDVSFNVSSTAQEKVYVREELNSEPTELVLVLDVSSSMLSDIDDLKSILNNAISSLEEQQQTAETQGHIKVAIVPFSDGVSVVDAPWSDKSGVFCVDGLQQPNDTLSAEETVANLDVVHDDKPVKVTAPDRWLSDCNENSPTLALTDDLNRVINSVNQLYVSGGTASYQGLIWGLRQLMPNWQREWNVGPAAYGGVNRKLVLMTDGADNNNALDQLVDAGLCRIATQDYGIEFNFIGFDVLDARLAQFSRCAGGTGSVFSANNHDELEQYFSQILNVDYDTTINFGNN